MKNLKILVTGGAGFIGSNFIHFLVQKSPDTEIVNLDALTYAGNLENLKELEHNKQYHFIKGNVCNYELIDFIIKKYQISHIVHFAAESHVDRSIKNPDIFLESNVKGSLTLLNAAKSNNIARFLQVSTDEVYGSLNFSDPPFTETTPIQPRSPYSASKAAADLLVLAYYHTFKTPIIITRCSNNYGPFQFPEKLIPLMIRNILMNKKLPVYGDGKNIRDWIYVEDHCSGIWKTLTEGNIGEVYNFGGNAERSNIDIVHKLLKRLKKGDDLIEFVKDRPGHDLRYAMDFTKAKTQLNWTPKFSFDDAMDNTIKWYLDNQPWVNNVTSGAYLDYYKMQYGGI